MSRVAKNPVTVPAGVEVKFGTEALTVKGKNGELSFPLNSDVKIELNDGQLTFAAANESKQANAMSGTARAIVANMVKGVAEGFEKKLQLIGVGYRAQAQRARCGDLLRKREHLDAGLQGRVADHDHVLLGSGGEPQHFRECHLGSAETVF